MIRSRQLAFAWRDGPLLEFPDVDLPQGGQLLLTGASGCGKSTWLALAAGLRRPARGDIQVAGQDLGQLGAVQLDAWRAQTIGLLPQRLYLSPALSVLDNLALPYFATGMSPDGQRMASLLDALGLSALGRRRPHELSVGQAQRVALARALLRSPRVMLADEPTASLDDAAAMDAMALLIDCAGQAGASLVVATHDARAHRAMPKALRIELAAGQARAGAAPAMATP